jgi:hypothetical protein
MTSPRGVRNSNQADVAFVTASLLAQVGCFTVLIVAVAIAGGLWLDGQFDTKPLFTVLFVLGSVPITFYFLIRTVVRGSSQLRKISQIDPDIDSSEEGDGGRNA